MSDDVEVEVVYALREVQDCVRLRLPAGATARDAVVASGVAERHPGLCIESGSIGVYGKLCAPDQVLRDGDRVEIYRPLLVDPRQGRLQRATAARKAAGSGGG